MGSPPIKPPKVLVLAGPTASGKSALAVVLATALNGEIVTADSRQVYRLMDIGTDKPGAVVRQAVPHHLIDLVFPDEPFTLADYQDQAYETINDIHALGRLPILAGGTPLYLNAVAQGWRIPRVAPNPGLRASLEAEAETAGTLALHDRLRSADPTAADGLQPTDLRRIVRALEVIEATGETMSSQQTRNAPAFLTLTILLALERSVLYERIDRRVNEQIRLGLVEEVSSLLDLGYGPELRSMSGLGYRQVCDYLAGRTTLPAAVQKIKWDTHAFARHQANWFRRLEDHVTFDAAELDLSKVTTVIRGFLEKPS